MLTLTFYLPLFQQAPDGEAPVFLLILVVVGAILATYICLRIGLRIMGGSLNKARRKPILKRFVDDDKRRR